MNNEANSLSTLFPSLTAQGATSQKTGYSEVLLNASLKTWKGVLPKLNRHYRSEVIVFWLAPV